MNNTDAPGVTICLLNEIALVRGMYDDLRRIWTNQDRCCVTWLVWRLPCSCVTMASWYAHASWYLKSCSWCRVARASDNIPEVAARACTAGQSGSLIIRQLEADEVRMRYGKGIRVWSCRTTSQFVTCKRNIPACEALKLQLQRPELVTDPILTFKQNKRFKSSKQRSC
jgi:hypothetical protein